MSLNCLGSTAGAGRCAASDVAVLDTASAARRVVVPVVGTSLLGPSGDGGRFISVEWWEWFPVPVSPSTSLTGDSVPERCTVDEPAPEADMGTRSAGPRELFFAAGRGRDANDTMPEALEWLASPAATRLAATTGVVVGVCTTAGVLVVVEAAGDGAVVDCVVAVAGGAGAGACAGLGAAAAIAVPVVATAAAVVAAAAAAVAADRFGRGANVTVSVISAAAGTGADERVVDNSAALAAARPEGWNVTVCSALLGRRAASTVSSSMSCTVVLSSSPSGERIVIVSGWAAKLAPVMWRHTRRHTRN